MSSWEKLIKRYANGRPICNCGRAYYTPCGKGIVTGSGGSYVEKTDLLICQYGCQANWMIAVDDLAECILVDLEKLR